MTTPHIAATAHDLRALTDDDVAAWRAVEARAADGNAFASPSFVLPALRHLRPGARGVLVLVTCAVPGGRQVVAAAPMERVPPSVHVPVPHWRMLWTEHSYQSGVLVDRDHLEAGCRGIVDWLHHARRPALHSMLSAVDSDTERALAMALRRRGWRWNEIVRHERAAIRPAEVDDDLLRERWSKNQRKKERRALRDLSEHGDVDLRVMWPQGDQVRTAVEHFLRLEAHGWKSDHGTAMAVSAMRAAFLRETCEAFARDRAFFVSELRAGNHVVATSVNFRSAALGFGFKIGWDADYEKCSPGTLHEHRWVRAAPDDLASLDEIDATADPGSFVDRIWPHRRTVVSGVWSKGRTARLALRGIDVARRLNRRRVA